MGIQTHVECKHYMDINTKGDPSGTLIDFCNVCELIFTFVFLAEILARLVAERKQFFIGESWKWNATDSCLSATALIGLSSDGSANLTFFRMIRLFRIVKMLHSLRGFRQF